MNASFMRPADQNARQAMPTHVFLKGDSTQRTLSYGTAVATATQDIRDFTINDSDDAIQDSVDIDREERQEQSRSPSQEHARQKDGVTLPATMQMSTQDTVLSSRDLRRKKSLEAMVRTSFPYKPNS